MNFSVLIFRRSRQELTAPDVRAKDWRPKSSLAITGNRSTATAITGGLSAVCHAVGFLE